MHTAVKIAPKYTGPVVHVLDASRAVGVASKLLSDSRRDPFVDQVKNEYAVIRDERSGQEPSERRITLAEARANRLALDGKADPAPAPSFLGVCALERYPLPELIERIDWTPFFQTWELVGRYPAILDDPAVGKTARGLFDDARRLLDRLVKENLLEARAVFGFFPAASDGDDIVLYTDDDRKKVRATVHTLRQQSRKSGGRHNLALADFVAAKASAIPDYIGAFAVTAGLGLDRMVEEFETANDDYDAILAKALADRLAEALAERLHQRVRTEFWGYAAGEVLDNDALIHEKYQGIRPAPGYPACPDHTEKGTLFDLLDAEKKAGMQLTESFAMLPAASVSGYYFWRPEAQYFGVGKIGKDQVEDYALRKGFRWRRWNGGWRRTWRTIDEPSEQGPRAQWLVACLSSRA